jgi:hypothetical protein
LLAFGRRCLEKARIDISVRRDRYGPSRAVSSRVRIIEKKGTKCKAVSRAPSLEHHKGFSSKAIIKAV